MRRRLVLQVVYMNMEARFSVLAFVVLSVNGSILSPGFVGKLVVFIDYNVIGSLSQH